VTERRAASSQRHSLPECTGTIASMDVVDGVLEDGMSVRRYGGTGAIFSCFVS